MVNLSRFAQAAELDLSRFSGCSLMEVFSQNFFPRIKKSPYVITLGPHSHYWFVVRKETAASVASKERKIPMLDSAPTVSALVNNGQRARIEHEILPAYIRSCRWFGAKARTLRGMRIVEEIPISDKDGAAQIWFVEVSYLDGPTETYALPVRIAKGDAARAMERSAAHAVIARLSGDGDAILHDAVYDESFRQELFALMTAAQSARGQKGNIVGLTSSAFPSDARKSVPPSQVLSAEQSNSSMLFENKFFLKLFRKLEDGVNPDVEVTRFLTERAQFPNVPAFLGAIEYRRTKAEPTVVCLLQSAVANEGDAWTLTLDAVGRYYERVLTRKADLQNQTTPPGPLLEELIGGVYREKAKLLGQRTGELHRALAISPDERGFAPEQFNAMAQRSVYQNMRASLRRNFALLEKKMPTLPDAFRDEAAQVLASEKQILAQEQRILDRRSNATKIRIHGDYHLGQVLYTGKDFIILDFEGEPARALGERKLKRSALRDVAGMMRSFQYAAYSALWQPAMRAEDVPFLERWADLWYRQMSSVFLQSYLEATDGAGFIPPDEGDFEILLEAYLLDKAVYEVGYELNNRPSWVVIPIRGIKHILGTT